MNAEDLEHLIELPEDALPMAVIEVVYYITSDEDDPQFAVRVGGAPHLTTSIGLLELTKTYLIHGWGQE